MPGACGEKVGFRKLKGDVQGLLGNRPDVVQGWSDLEAARRWWNISSTKAGCRRRLAATDGLFRRAAGRPQTLQREREERGCRLMQGIRHSRAIFL